MKRLLWGTPSELTLIDSQSGMDLTTQLPPHTLTTSKALNSTTTLSQWFSLMMRMSTWLSSLR